MNMKSFLLGVLTGVVLTFGVLYIIGSRNEKSDGSDPIEYLDRPVSYENKAQSSFKVFQVLGDAALATEISDEDLDMYLGNTVVIIGENFYTDQIVNIKNPQRVGTYSYTNKGGIPMTVPVLNGELK